MTEQPAPQVRGPGPAAAGTGLAGVDLEPEGAQPRDQGGAVGVDRGRAAAPLGLDLVTVRGPEQPLEHGQGDGADRPRLQRPARRATTGGSATT